MASNTVEQIFVELLLNAKGYNKEADQAVKKGGDLERGLKRTEKQSLETNKSFTAMVGGIGKVIKGIAGLASVIAAGTGLLRLADEARKANDELNFLSKNLGMTSRDVKAWQGAATAMGGSAQGMTNDMKSLNSSMNDFVVTGESSMLPIMNTLGVSMIDAQGKVRDTNDVMLDLADSMSKMDREQAFLMGQKLGFDEGTINSLLQGRDAMKEMVDYHKQMYSSNKQELEASRKLSENQAKLSAHWDSMKLMMGNAIIPLLVKLSNVALKFFEFLQRHQKTVKNVFEGMAIFLGVLVVPLLTKALVALVAFIAPFAPFIAVVGALGAAFVLLYDDYKTWAEGGNSLFNWGAFREYIDNSRVSTENLSKGFLYLVGDYKSWAEVASDGKAWLKMKGFIDENGVSLSSLRLGFTNLTKDILQYAMPTLQGYASILSKLMSGDFSGAFSEAKDMYVNYLDKLISVGKSAINRVSGAIDTATGQEVGTLSQVSIMNDDKPKSGNYTAKQGSGNKNDFVKKYLPVAQKVSKELNVPVDALLGQWALETGWGKSITKGTGYNLGNIKAGSNWKGDTVRAYDKAEKSNDLYRVYNTPDEFAKDYISLISKNKRYQGALGSKNAKEYFTALKQGGYATDPNYINSGVSVSRSAANELMISQGAQQAQNAMPKANMPSTTSKNTASSSNSNVEVNVKEINVNTSASTVTGTISDAASALVNKMYQFPIGAN